MSGKPVKLGMHPQGSTIKLFGKEDSDVVDYETQSIHYELLPTGVAVCRFNTPKDLNCLHVNQQWEIFALLEHMTRDDNVRVAIWTGTGRAFNSGADLTFGTTMHIPEKYRKAMLSREMAPRKEDAVLKDMVRAFWDFPKVSICAVNGLAVGGAANIALMNLHDFVLCSDTARFMYPFPKLGFTPEVGSSVMMPFLVGMAKAKELFYLSDWFTAIDAKEMGLINKIVPGDKLMSEAMNMAERLVLLHPASLTRAKKILHAPIRERLDGILDAENENIHASLKETGGPLAIKQYMEEKKKWLEEVKSKL